MSVRNLKKSSETDWTRLDRMTDEEIDTSDIPPLDDAFFASAKWRLPRFYIYLYDLKESKKFAAYILKHELHDKASTELRQLTFSAFHNSLIITYGRVFRMNRGFEGQPKASLEKFVPDVLDPDEIRLHQRVLAMRDTAVAHSDSRSHLFEHFDYTKGIGLMRLVDTLTNAEIKALRHVINKWIQYLEAEKSRLKGRLRDNS